ncbi:type II toxin-antitoxin system RelE/ParE family toxin [Caulobacter segnis]|uniref:Type II toxin-antitoxin system mRNA interferase toxin, RelE/StbE family n=1 Tax=Caulobacter segnis TaxID=88688 RepID=A0A2W5VFZ9_9CAUL|nr:type II toxin-antitoxin system RelE/ParE family toxin [Caulobacter segnis]PZR37387.1 MAG: type II toxin-antitoxin system mRNA interferase toxin, RelE/StbE family [Caulobacter segnis]
MKVRWTATARLDRLEIMDHIASHSPRAALRMDQLFSDAAAALAEFPLRGRPGLVAGTREVFPHETYRLVYELDGDTVWILTLLHTARRWPAPRE